MTTDTETSKIAQITKPITGYRDWVGAQSRGMRVLLLVGLFALFMAVGLGLAATGASGILTTAVAWVWLLFTLYTLYALARSVVANVRG